MYAKLSIDINKLKKEKLEILKQRSCHTCQNMSCRVEVDEKPEFNCVGYINNEYKLIMK